MSSKKTKILSQDENLKRFLNWSETDFKEARDVRTSVRLHYSCFPKLRPFLQTQALRRIFLIYFIFQSGHPRPMKKPRSLLKKVAISALRIVIVSYVLVLAGLYFFQEKLIFIPMKLDANYEYNFRGSYSERPIRSGGLVLDSVLFKTKDSKGLILYLHGNAGHMTFWGQIATELAAKTHFDVWMIDYPGFGKSEGSINSEKQLHEMSENFWTEAKREYPNAPILVYGRSIGTGLATQLAASEKANGLILESPYFSLLELASGMYPWVPTALLRYSFRSDEWIRKVDCPILIFHGTFDEIIPFGNGKRLAEVKQKTTFVEVAGGHHNDLSRRQQYWDELVRWTMAIQ